VQLGPYPGTPGTGKRTIGSAATGPLTHTRSVTRRRLRILFAVQGAAFGLLMPFPVPLLDERGLGAAEIGLILSIAGLASLLAYPLWGMIADGWLGRPRTIALASVAAAIGGGLILASGSDRLSLTFALSVAVAGAMAWGPLIDALVLGELGEAASDYGRVRVWASAGWALSATAGGAVWALAGPEPVFVAFTCSALLLAALVLLPAMGASQSGDAHEQPPRLRLLAWLPRFITPVLLGFMAGLLLTSMGEHASWRFISLRILDQGGGVFLVGLAASLPALVEIPVFASSRRLAPRFGLRGLFVLGAAVAASLTALIAIAPEAWMVAGLRTLDGVSFALRYMAMVLIIGVLLPPRLYAMGQSMAWFIYAGIAPIAADAAGGIIYETLGAPVLFLVATAALALGGLIVWLVLRAPAFGRDPPRGVVEEVPPPLPPA